MRCVLAEDIKLSLEMFFVKMTLSANISIAIVGTENNKGLENERLCAAGGWSEDGTVGWYLTPAKDSEVEITGDTRKDGLILLDKCWVVGLEENVTNGVFTRLWQFSADVSFCLALKQSMRDACHHASTITITTVSTGGASMGHGAKQLPSVRDNFVVLFTFDVANKADSTGIFLELIHIKALTGWHCTGP